jgi:hypothetical protein
MTALKLLTLSGAGCCVVVALLSSNTKAQRKQEPPSIAFGGAQVSLGMRIEQVEKNLAETARHIEFMSDKHTALVCSNNAPCRGGQGQITFLDGQVAYAAFDFPAPRDANELAQELAGAVDDMDSKLCTVSNFSGHGTGGGYSQTTFHCGSKSFEVITAESLGSNERYTPEVKITIGEVPRSK